jgi:hypothetical protein
METSKMETSESLLGESTNPLYRILNHNQLRVFHTYRLVWNKVIGTPSPSLNPRCPEPPPGFQPHWHIQAPSDQRGIPSIVLAGITCERSCQKKNVRCSDGIERCNQPPDDVRSCRASSILRMMLCFALYSGIVEPRKWNKTYILHFTSKFR